MNKVNIQGLDGKLTKIYGDECEKNVVGIIIYENNGAYFFDEEFEHPMNNEEMEALLLRGAVIKKDGAFHSPASFNNEGVSFGAAESSGKHEHDEYITEAEVDAKILAAQLPEGEIDVSSLIVDQTFDPLSSRAQSGIAVEESMSDFTVTPNFDAWSHNLVDRETLETGLWSASATAVDGIIASTSYSHTPCIDVSAYSKIAFRFKDDSFSWTKYTWGFWMYETNTVSNTNKIAVQGEWDETGGPEIVLDVPTGVKYIVLNFYSKPDKVDTRFYLKGFIGGSGEKFVNGDKIYPPINSYIRYYYGEQYQGKKWVSFGDSITAQATWQPIVAEKLGLVHVNCGVGSTCLGTPASANYLPEQAFNTDLRLDAVKAEDPDIVTILGGANDLYGGVQVGDVSEFDKELANKDRSTFLGAYSYIIENLLTWKPTLKIIILTTTFGHNNKNYAKYADASREVAHNYGLLCADLYRKTGFNSFTAKQGILLKDGIHPNDAGGARIAAVVLATFLEG